jgi:hypothetical protein
MAAILASSRLASHYGWISAVLTRKSLKRWQHMCRFHPAYALCRLDMGAGWQGVWIIERCRLDIDNAGQKLSVVIK